MATRLYRAGVPMPEIVEMGEWEDEAMARTYIRTLQAFAGERRNLSDVSARKRKASSSVDDADGVGDADGEAASPVRAVVAADGETALTETSKQRVAVGRAKESAVCCPVKYVAQGGCVVRTRKLEEDQVLQQLWESAAGWPAGRVRQMLCDNEYHCSCKEI